MAQSKKLNTAKAAHAREIFSVESVMQQLQSLGTSQNVKVYRRHGCGENVFGVSYANLRKLARQIGHCHSLAVELWETENSDARSIAMLVAEPDRLKTAQADAWCRTITYRMHATELADVVARSPIATSRMKAWCRRKSEFVRATGYSVVCAILKYSPETLSLEECSALIDAIQEQIHASPNRARHSMSLALIAIAESRPQLIARALAAGENIGVVEVDHGETSCKTPQIASTIRKMKTQTKRTKSRHTC